MSSLPDLTLLPLLLVVAGTAGVDLALAILVLGVAPLLGWSAPPGDLVYLQAPWVVAAGATLYLAEAVMERHPASFSVWHTFQRWVRLLGLVLLAEMATVGMAPGARWLAAALMVAVGLASYVASSGWQGMVILRRLPRRTQILASAGVDVVFAALLLLALEEPLQALVALTAVTALAAPRLPVALRGHRAVIDAGRAWIRAVFDPGQWTEPAELPTEVQAALAGLDDGPVSAPRGTPALLLDQRLRRGWLLAGSGDAWFVPSRAQAIRISRLDSRSETGDPLYIRLPVTAGEREWDLLVHRDGPTRRELEREIPLSREASPTSRAPS